MELNKAIVIGLAQKEGKWGSTYAHISLKAANELHFLTIALHEHIST